MPTPSAVLRTASRATSRAAILAAVGASLLASTPALAETTAGARSDVTVALDSVRPSSAEANAHRDSAQALLQRGDLRRAQREFLASARAMRAAGQLPVVELTSAATIAYDRNHRLDAAYILETLIDDAVTFGRPDVQAQALIDVASLYAIAGQRERARARLETLHPLLASPFVAEGVRRQAAGLVQTASR